MAILLEIAAASDAHAMWERRLNELCRMHERQPCFVDRDGKWGLRDFLDYAREAMGCARDSDGSGEADKTGTGLAEGDSAGPQGHRHNTSTSIPIPNNQEQEPE